MVRIYDIKPIVKKFKFEEASQANITSKFNIMKKDDINVEAIVNYYLQKYFQFSFLIVKKIQFLKV